MTLLEFEELVSDALGTLPKVFKDQLDNVQIVADSWPNQEDLGKIGVRKHSLLYGLYTGVPKTKRGAYYSALPDKITIFAGPILYTARDLEDVKRMVRDTVLHEIGHHFGMSEEEIMRAT